MARDIRVEADNAPGTLAAIGEALGASGINIEGFCAIVDGGTGYLHLLVADGAGARVALQGAGLTGGTDRDAVVVDITGDRPGYLGETCRKLADAGINIDASYVGTANRIVFVVDDPAAARAALG